MWVGLCAALANLMDGFPRPDMSVDRPHDVRTQSAVPDCFVALPMSKGALAGGQALGLLLSPEGEYVRGIVTNELAKGIDASWRLALDSAVDNLRGQLMAVFGVRSAQTVPAVHFRPPPPPPPPRAGWGETCSSVWELRQRSSLRGCSALAMMLCLVRPLG